MKTKLFLIFLVVAMVKVYPQYEAKGIPEAHFIVFSDPHYFDPSLWTEGKAFQDYLDHDRKLLRESRDLLLQAIQIVKSSGADFVVVPGDLTKDGTMVSHKVFASLMEELTKNGIPVFVVPGNHDILNGESKAFDGDTSILMENITPEQFREIYNSMGYGKAISSDLNSLSYVSEPIDGLWLLGLDACRYKDNIAGTHPVTDGAFSEETLTWVEEIANRAAAEEKRIITFMHHGINEHYKGQEKFFGEYLVDDYKKISKRFASLGINIVFTGHYHAQDVTVQNWKNGDFIFDVETGSLVTYPCPVREVLIMGDTMTISSRFIEKTETHPEGFKEYGREYVHSGISGIAEKTLISYHLKPLDAAKLSGQIGDAFVTHYLGDEPPRDHYLDMQGVGLLGRIMILFKKKMIVGLYNDLPPQDNNIVIDLGTGAFNDGL